MADISSSNEPVVQEVSSPTTQADPKKDDSEPETGMGTNIYAPPTPKNQGNTTENEKKPRKPWKVILKYLPHVLSVLALGVSFSSQNASWESAGNSKRSADAATQSADTARRSLEVSTRPWIDISGTKLQSDIAPDVLVPFETLLTNVGKIPAQNVTAYFAMGASKKCICFPSGQKEEFGSMAPGTKRHITADMQPRNSDIIEQVRQGNLVINLCAEIRYEDDFSKHRRTTANWYYKPREGRKFSICPNGNTME